ncbi:MAG: hypothetical protein NTZ38_01470, partial [Candidatus Taylorbacteria bacterium]|nr:hypothetical protein [Candidatus Taylorbacteria bacterium]
PCAGVNSQILLSQSKVISSKRLLRKIGHIKLNTYQKVIIGLTRLILGSSEGETPPYGGESRRPNGHGEHSIYL